MKPIEVGDPVEIIDVERRVVDNMLSAHTIGVPMVVIEIERDRSRDIDRVWCLTAKSALYWVRRRDLVPRIRTCTHPKEEMYRARPRLWITNHVIQPVVGRCTVCSDVRLISMGDVIYDSR
jgi:hypothetical protein